MKAVSKHTIKIFKNQDAEIKKFLIQEEYKAEFIISIIRVIIYFFCALEFLLAETFNLKIDLQLPFIPFFVIFFLSAAMLVEIILWRNKALLKYFNHYMKYIYIMVDTISISILTFYMTGGIAGTTNEEWVLSVFFILMSSFLLILAIFRYDAPAVIYTGLILTVAYFITYSRFFNTHSIFSNVIFKGNQYNIAAAVPIWGISGLTVICFIITVRIRKILLRSKRQEKLERFLPEIVANDIIQGNTPVNLGGTRQNATILFSDIRNFTRLSEKYSPEDIVDILNAYYHEMINLIFKYNGTLDKLLGDGIMAIFGAPLSTGDDTSNSVRCAIEMIAKVKEFNKSLTDKGLPSINIGIGIHTGDVVIGYLGTEKRMDFTAIGDTVNTASRLESLTKEYKVPIIISEATHKQVDAHIDALSLGKVKIRGKADETEIFKIVV